MLILISRHKKVIFEKYISNIENTVLITFASGVYV